MKYKTNNEAWGFYGTSVMSFELNEAAANHIYDYTAKILAEKYHVKDPVEFLDSRYGRHFCDQVMNESPLQNKRSLKGAIVRAAKKWKNFNI